MENAAFSQCIRRLCSGDRDALREIYDAYHGFLFHLILAIVGNWQDAEDVTVEAFVKIWRSAESFREGSLGHKGWLAAIGRNQAVDFLRKNRREIPSGTWEVEERKEIETADSGPDELESFFSDLAVEELLLRLKPEEREVVHLKIAGDMTFSQIAKTLGVPMGTVSWRYRNAVKKLKEVLS